ncbi:hypothetical protein D9599_28035 [Roseomonas sp. KE2513]|uniref:hypothetical protein n=1 Tax=Roseomonas sp. KE2513 TaxID=2479202 RepID=UPI0018DFBC00|nr:hypothetical protein [Roseomonas sp. KE2513]MBI0539378.1 hypothetical protein [Roseomonas sp. KE2513]
MSEIGKALQGRRIAVAEDEYMIADEVAETLSEAGAELVGAVARVGATVELARGRHDGFTFYVIKVSKQFASY